MAIEPQSLADRKKLLSALNMLARSDPTFEYYDNDETGQTLVCGMGELHLEVMKYRLEHDFQLRFKLGKPLVAYREGITRAAEAEGRVIPQSGGRGPFAAVTLRVEPFTPDPGEEHFKFVNACCAGSIRSDFFRAIEKSLRTARQSGGLGGYPLINVKVTLLDGEDHPGESTEAAFEGAAALAFNRAIEQAGPILLEPVMKVEVVTPKEYYGTVHGDLMARRAMITRTDVHGRNHVITAEVPLAEMFGYATRVRGLSQGRASYSMEPCRHERIPPDLAPDILGPL
jgi:elongation factor G